MRFLVGIVSAKMSLVGVSSLPLVPEAFDRRYGSPSGVRGLKTTRGVPASISALLWVRR